MSRWTPPAPEGSQHVVVLKDLNFEGQFITLGEETGSDTIKVQSSGVTVSLLCLLSCLCPPRPPCPRAAQQRSWLLLQVDIDAHFLERLNVLDYSFLLAQQPLQPDEQLQLLSLRTLIIRTKR